MADSLTPPEPTGEHPRRKPSIKPRWYREVVRSPLISDSVRVLLLVLHEDMAADGFVSVPRKQLAARLGKDPRRIAERIEQAVAAGLLFRLRAGQPGVTAEYRATFPGGRTERVRPSSSKPIERLTKSKDGADDRPTSDEDGADVRMVRIAAPIEVRTSASTPHAQHGADDPPANHSATLRSQRDGSTSELLSDEVEVDASPEEVAAIRSAALRFAERCGVEDVPLIRGRVVA